ncbi:DUF4411 family protein [Devosia sp. A16]|uniref:DUF4411 family protein n=1 Tax=Devosia sp. A16 TaxID=1736675 RepID=UPI0006D7B6F3|nr:DUF4411 family protein [Devosia sp. A16]
MVYLLDSNVFIEAQNRYYAFDIVPAFWDWMDTVIGPNVATVAPVRDELIGKDDPLAAWMKQRQNDPWVLPVDDKATQEAYAEIAIELDGSNYRRPAIEKFLSGADPWLIAKAKVLKATIVTHEVAAPDAVKRVPIPNLCVGRKVPCINTFDALRALQAQFRHHPR